MPGIVDGHHGAMRMLSEQHALRFSCQSCSLQGILSLPATPQARGVLIVTGGPQYRAGSHRQFALLAQHLAGAGIPVLRFDYRGMGDSEGEVRTYEHLDEDLQAAVATFFDAVPCLQELVIWGLCDGAAAAAYYAHQESRVCGLILLNPWVRTAPGIARATLRHYYLARLFDRAFWRKLASGRIALGAAARSLRQLSAAARASQSSAGTPAQRLYDALARFQGRVLIVLSGEDLTAREFVDLQQGSAAWRTLLAAPAVQQVHVAHANHTFSRRLWRDQVALLCSDWLAAG